MREYIPNQLVGILARNEPLALAYSGGLDSRFLAYVCKICQIDVLLMLGTGYNFSQTDTMAAKEWAEKEKLKLVEIDLDPFRIKAIRMNKRDRCYHCKREIFKRIQKTLQKMGQDQRVICDGTNYDDLKIFRPGQKAINDLNILTPLAQSLLSKNDIRRIGAEIGLSDIKQKPSPCLLTRVAYNLLPQKADLNKIDRCENELKEFFKTNLPENADLPDLRLRLTPEPLLQITDLPGNLRSKVRQIITEYGFTPCQLLIEENVSGFFDKIREDPAPLPLL
ncbi:MAG: PP-loop family protein [Desulfovibrionaceae bacterium]|nr:PP-loop family protein [Desulfovibrionaceae bacterium]